MEDEIQDTIQKNDVIPQHNTLARRKNNTKNSYVGREGTWTSAVLQYIKDTKIGIEPENVLKSTWKKEVKSKLEMLNERDVKNECEKMRKRRTISKGKWGKKEYMELGIETAREILKSRLHMMPLPCNYGKSNDGCSLCSHTAKTDTEHYLTCKGMLYMQNKWKLSQNIKLETEDWEEARTISRYLRQVCILLGTGKMDESA